MKDAIAKALQEFDTIALTEMYGAELMDRTDTKYVLNSSSIPVFLEHIKADYNVLEMNGVLIQSYESLYYDTPDFKMYQDHHSGKTPRYKIRARTYVESDLHFLEIKFRRNTNRTIKSRIGIRQIDPEISKEQNDFLFMKSAYHNSDLEAKLWSNCSRVTLVNKKGSERLTLDFDIEFRGNNKKITLPKLAIVEIKQLSYFHGAGAEALLKMRIRNSQISKYCLGVGYLYEEMKRNNFKSGILQINKIQNENHL